jgi:CheY-like chemotaxis protein
MSTSASTVAPAAKILVACDNASDATQVSRQLLDEFELVLMSIDPDAAARDFERHRPAVLVLAFNSLEKAEAYYLGLYRLCPTVQQVSHRTIILCNKDEVKRVFELCKKNYFDDYVLFWPMTYDMSRLAMAVHHALRELATLSAGTGGPSVVEFSAQARRLGELEALLAQSLSAGGQHMAVTDRALAQASQDIGAALDGFSHKLTDGSLPEPMSRNNTQLLQQEIDRLKREDVMQSLRSAAKSTEPLKSWTDGVKQACAPVLESVRALNSMAERVRPTVLVVDDDEFQRKTVAQMLGQDKYQLLFAAGGVDALGVLRKTRPDLILMDLQMPDLNGVDVTRQLKAVPRLAGIPVIIITGHSDRVAVAQSLKAGATGFMVKPLVRENLLAKVEQALRTSPG